MYQKIVDRIKEYNPSLDENIIINAYKFAESAHKDQKRVSGEPYIIHPLEVAYILADLELDVQSIIAGLLHDVVEDTEYTVDDIRKKFGNDVAELVDGVTKLTRLTYTSKIEEQAENFRKMFIAMAKDIRVVLIKLADRLHNMRTLKYMRPEKQREKALETKDIYAPLAHRLGMSKLKWELEDLSFRYLYPEEYYELASSLTKKRKEREEYINLLIDMVKEKIEENNITAEIDGRPKHLFSIYKKMKTQNKTLDQIYDLFAIRLLVNTVQECYTVLGIVHELFKPVPGRFKDYIAMPKANMYQSLHTTLIGPNGVPFEIQIRTWEMHRISEYGIAAHWKYKEGRNKSDEFDEKLAWIRRLIEWERDMNDPEEFMETLKIDLFTDEVFVFSPKGDVIILPAGATPVDFAYSIHSAVGNKMMGARINSKIVPIDCKLNNGDRVEIITSSNIQGPSMDWLKFVKSSQAKNKIKQFFRKANRETSITAGKEIVDRECKKQGMTYNSVLSIKEEQMDLILRKNGCKKLDDLLAMIGFGEYDAIKLVSKVKEILDKKVKADKPLNETLSEVQLQGKQAAKNGKSSTGIVIGGVGEVMVKFSKCCNPVYGDEVVGYVTRGRGVSIHRKDCKNLENIEDVDRLVEVNWADNNNVQYTAELKIVAIDRSGFVLDITNMFQEENIQLKAISAVSKDRTAIINVALLIKSTNQLEKIIKNISRIRGIIEVTRL